MKMSILSLHRRTKAVAVGRRLRQFFISCCLSYFLFSQVGLEASAQECHGNVNALGTARVLALDPAVLPAVGTFQYPRTVPLRDHEVVLTFDDGPGRSSTDKVLDALAAQCVKANFFVVGAGARVAPDLVRREYSEGHTVGTHSESHADLAKLPLNEAEQEIQAGIDAVGIALGSRNAVAPFFRAPYLSTTPSIEDYLLKKGLMLWSIDVDPEDWRPLTPDEVVQRTMFQLEKKRSGIILMHDVQAHTAAALPRLLNELKLQGYSVVHTVFGSPKEPTAHAR